ncbi:MAG: aspartate/glutamate racemase family protein [Deltaproteobacteria bacterium]|nr:aspartate/glutamate racemase family protein [Deltaproteobacteria bacterium]MBW2120510.1 aspartate/glutamate racemase family protein [Deltaproteobacteria bacterium]
MQVEGGRRIYGAAIGIAILDLKYPLIPGNVGNASTYDFPVRIKVIKGLHHAPSPPIYDEKGDYTPDVKRFVRAVKELEHEGVRAIVGSCGFFALLQKVAVEEVNVPVFTSPLMLIPVICRMIHPEKKIGVITASAKRLTRAYLEPVGVDESMPLVIAGLDDSDEFNEVLMQGRRDILDPEALRKDVVAVAKDLARGHPDVGVILLECSDLPPFAADIQKAVGLPVFDFIGFINAIQRAVVQKPYVGIL